MVYQILNCIYGTPASSNWCPQICLKHLGLNSKTNNDVLFYKIKSAANKFWQKQMIIWRYNRYPTRLLEDLIIHQHLLWHFTYQSSSQITTIVWCQKITKETRINYKWWKPTKETEISNGDIHTMKENTQQIRSQNKYIGNHLKPKFLLDPPPKEDL